MTGIVIKFDPQKGYGFIRSQEAREDMFVHISDVQGRIPLRIGQHVEFQVVQTGRGSRAVRVVPGAMQRSPIVVYGAIGISTALVVMLALSLLTRIHILLAWFLSISMVTFVLYRLDKYRAETSGFRVPEMVLHGLSLLGGSPGALAGQRMPSHHKTAKASFQVVFWLIFMGQIALTIFLLTR
ncbi:MAG: DUF1294 domain-containing protein [Chloroflexi bacterium]|nr:DUF1294 domain-containing protein [Chloroflexota bacterium]